MARLNARQKKNRAALLALGHRTVASAIAEIRQSMPDFDKKYNYPKVRGICPPLADIVLHVRKTKPLAFDHVTGNFTSGNARHRAAHGITPSREGRFPQQLGHPWHPCGQ